MECARQRPLSPAQTGQCVPDCTGPQCESPGAGGGHLRRAYLVAPANPAFRPPLILVVNLCDPVELAHDPAIAVVVSEATALSADRRLSVGASSAVTTSGHASVTE